MSWSGLAHQPATYGNLLLGPPAYSAPKVTNAPTVDGVINAAEYANARRHQARSTPRGLFDSTKVTTPGRRRSNFSFRVVHTANAVYVGRDVTDDQIVNDTVRPAEGEMLAMYSVDASFLTRIMFVAPSVTLGAPVPSRAMDEFYGQHRLARFRPARILKRPPTSEPTKTGSPRPRRRPTAIKWSSSSRSLRYLIRL